MSDPETAAPRNTAGALLRAARERQGLHIAALAAAIKVTPRKLDALEHDRYDELPDATFTRALAQTVCRTLKIDARPVLALLPQPDMASLVHAAGSLNAPFRERPGRDDSTLALSAIRPLVWASGLLMLAALVVHFLPAGLWESLTSTPVVPAPAASAASAPLAVSPAPAASVEAPASAAESGAAPAPVVAASAIEAPPAARVETVHSAPPVGLQASAVLPSSGLHLRTTEASWIEVQDGRGQLLLSRTVQPGESVGLDGAVPLRLTIGNAAATQLGFRGRVVDLAGATRDNVARLELK